MRHKQQRGLVLSARLVVLAVHVHPSDQEPIGINDSSGLLPESEELVTVSAEEAVLWHRRRPRKAQLMSGW